MSYGIRHQSNDYVLMDSRDITVDILAAHPNLLQVRNRILDERQIHEDEINGVVFNGNPSAVYLTFSPSREEGGQFFLTLSSITSSNISGGVGSQLSRSVYATLGVNRGYIQRKPCGSRQSDGMPFYLTVAKKDFKTLTGDYHPGDDLAQMFVDEVGTGTIGPITQHIEGNWEVMNGMLRSEAEREVLNGLRFAELYEKVHGEYPTGQVPVGVSVIKDVYMPDGSIVNIRDLLVERFDSRPLEFSMMKVRLLYYESQRMQEQGTDPQEIGAVIADYKHQLDKTPVRDVIEQFLEEDPFVQANYHTPAFARLSYAHILSEPLKYSVIRTIAGGESSTPTSIFNTVSTLYRTVVRDFVEAAGLDSSQVSFPDAGNYHRMIGGINSGVKNAVAQYIWDTGTRNGPLFREVLSVEIQKMARSVALVNAIGADLYASLWDTNMIAGSPCDWDWFANKLHEYLPQSGVPIEAKRGAFIEKTGEQNWLVDENLIGFLTIFGLPETNEREFYNDEYMQAFDISTQVLVESGEAELHPNYVAALKRFPIPRKSFRNQIVFNHSKFFQFLSDFLSSFQKENLSV